MNCRCREPRTATRNRMRQKKPTVHGLQEFGLSVSKLKSLGTTKIKLHADLRHLKESSLFKFAPVERQRMIEDHYERQLLRVRRAWPLGGLDTVRVERPVRRFHCTVEARHVSSFFDIEALERVWIDEVEGRKRIRASRKPNARWYAVQARFAIQVEGQRRGLQTYEDRTLVFRAQGPEAAKRKLKAESALYGQPYLNPDGYMVRWAFERILDVYDLYDEEFNPEGTEVASVLKERRMKPEFEWKTGRRRKDGGSR